MAYTQFRPHYTTIGCHTNAPADDVISVGRDNRFGHPSPEVLKRLDGDAVFRTDLHGDIVISTDGRRLWIETGR